MRQRLVRIESRNAGVVVTVSDRALSVRFPMLMSFAQDGINPQRMVVKWRIFLPCSLRTIRTGCVGAMLYRECSSTLQLHHPPPETVQQGTASSASVGIDYTHIHSHRSPISVQLPSNSRAG